MLTHLNAGAQTKMQQRAHAALVQQQQHEEGGCEQQHIHFDGHGEAVENASNAPPTGDEQVHGAIQQRHGDRVVEQPQCVDGVDPVGGAAHEEQHIRRHLVEDKSKKQFFGATSQQSCDVENSSIVCVDHRTM